MRSRVKCSGRVADGQLCLADRKLRSLGQQRGLELGRNAGAQRQRLHRDTGKLHRHADDPDLARVDHPKRLDPSGYSAIAITAALNNTGTINLGNGILTSNSEISAATLSNTGTINLQGDNALGTGEAAILDIAAADPSAWTGHLSLAGQALLEFGSGSISSVANGAQIYLATSQGYIADNGATSTNSALTGLNAVAGDFELQYGANVNVNGNLNVTGSLGVDTQSDYGDNPSGGSTLRVAQTLINSGTVSLGNGFFGNGGDTADTTIYANSLQNTGTINLTGNSATGNTKAAQIIVATAAPTVWTGALSMANQALLEFGSGSIQDVAAGAEIYLATSDGYIANQSSLSTNSALTGLAQIHGDFEEQYGAAVTVNNGLTVYGSLNLDTQSNYGDTPAGGSSIKIGGALVNDGYVDIGNGFFGALLLTSTTTITAGSLQNNGTINLSGNNSTTGSTKQADLIVTSAAPSQLTGTINLNGEALLEFASGSFSSIAAGAVLNINTPDGYVADQGATTSNSALTGLTANAGTLNLEYGNSVNLTGGFNNSGTLDIDTASPSGWFNTPAGVITGGSSFSAVGLVENSGAMNFGIGGVPQPTTIGFGGLQNDASGSIKIIGAPTVETSVTVTGAAQSVWQGSLSLADDAILTFGSGTITSIASGATIYVGANTAGVGVNGVATPNAALSGITSNQGALNFEYGAVATLTGSLLNTGTFDINSYSGSGSTNVSVAGTVTNQATVNIGSGANSAAVTSNFGGFVNSATGTLTVYGYIYTTAFDVYGAFSNAGTANFGFGVHAAVAGFSNTGAVNITAESGVPTSFEVIGNASNAYNLTVGGYAQFGVTGTFTDGGYLNLSGSLDLQSGIEVTFNSATHTYTLNLDGLV